MSFLKMGVQNCTQRVEPMRPEFERGQRGLTLLELMIALVVIAILISVSAPGFNNFRETQRLVSAAEQLSGHLNQARSEAVARSTPVFVNFSADGGTGWTYGMSSVNDNCNLSTTTPTTADACVLIIDDGDGIEGPEDRVLMRFSGEEFGDVSMTLADFPTGSSQIRFDPVRGMATVGRMDLQGAGGDRLRVRVSRMGRVTLCSPGAQVAQYSSAGC